MHYVIHVVLIICNIPNTHATPSLEEVANICRN